MFRRLLVASLAVMTFAIAARADLHRNDDHQFEAEFPTRAEQLNKPIEGNGKIVMAHARDNGILFSIGAVVDTGEELSSEHTSEFGNAFVKGIMNTRKNATILKEEVLTLSDHTPKGSSFIVKHEEGCFFAWSTIENGKGYFVLIEAGSEESLKNDAVKNFQKSVKIKGVK